MNPSPITDRNSDGPSEWLNGVKARVEATGDGYVRVPQSDWDGVIHGFEWGEVLFADATDALKRIAAQQPKTLETLRSHGIVFDGPLGTDPKNWQHVAFSIYTDLCEVDSWANEALVTIHAAEPEDQGDE